FGLCAGLFLGSTFVSIRVPDQQVNSRAFSSTIAVAVFVAAYFGLALQYFQLRLRKQGTTIVGLFLFLIWVVPILVGTITMAAFTRSMSDSVALQVLFGLSPLSSLVMSSDLGDFAKGTDTLRLAALAPAIGFASLFHILLTS